MMEHTQAVAVPVKPTTALSLDKAALQRIQQDIALLEEFTQENLVPDIDYGRVWGVPQPFLLEPGAAKIINAFKCFARHKLLKETIDPEEGIITFIMEAELVSRETGEAVATGVGVASTLEGKYGSRWLGGRDLEELGIAPEGLRTRTGGKKGEKYTQYRVPNPDWGDLVHTLLAMAAKRAEADAAKSLPGVSTALGILFAGERGPEWRSFWGSMRSAGISEEQVHFSLGVVSLKDYLSKGHTLEEAKRVILEKCGKVEEKQAVEEPKTESATVLQDIGQDISKPPRDPSTLKNKGELFTAVWQDFKLNKTQALEKLGLRSDLDIGTPADAYLQIWTVMGGG